MFTDECLTAKYNLLQQQQLQQQQKFKEKT